MSERGDRISESTVALIAASIHAGLAAANNQQMTADYGPLVEESVAAARAIVAKILRTQPLPVPPVPREAKPEGATQP